MDLRIITKNQAADQEKGFLTKSGSEPYGRETAMPTACVLTYCSKLKIKFLTLYQLNFIETEMPSFSFY